MNQAAHLGFLDLFILRELRAGFAELQIHQELRASFAELRTSKERLMERRMLTTFMTR